MAKTYKELMLLPNEELKAELLRLNRQANRRLTMLENSMIGRLSPSYTERIGRGTKGKAKRFTSKNLKDLNKDIELQLKKEKSSYAGRTERDVLINQINKTKSFLSNKTSTVSGFKKVRKELNKKLNAGAKKSKRKKTYFPEEIKTEAQLKRQLYKERRFWRLYKRGEQYPNYATGKEIPSKMIKRILTKLINRGFTNAEIQDRLNYFVNKVISNHSKIGVWEDDEFETKLWKNIREKDFTKA